MTGEEETDAKEDAADSARRNEIGIRHTTNQSIRVAEEYEEDEHGLRQWRNRGRRNKHREIQQQDKQTYRL